MSVRFGRYETLYPLASGGMATVHLARAIGAGGFERLVAIKVMHPGLGEDADFAAMFLDEARVAARIRHPNVVGTVDVQEAPEGLFLVMEFVEGPSLFAVSRALTKKGRRMPIGVALRILIDALSGLHAAHEQTGPTGEPLQIVHRDVSPQNILVSVDGQAKITDFGVARAEARLSSTRRGEVKGKLSYMSPQQVRSEDIDRRADVYAAAVVLWEMLAGTRLFRGDNDGALVVAVMEGAQRSPREVNPEVPAAIDRECMRALRLDPNERHPTALAFAEALEIAAEEAGVTLATPRVLAAFVKELGAHKPIQVPASPVEPPVSRPRPSAPGAKVAPAAPASQPGSAAPSPTEDEAPTTVAPSTASRKIEAPAADLPPAAPPEANSQVASVLPAPAAPPAPSRSPARIVGAVVAAAAVVAGAALMGSRFLAPAPLPPAPAAVTPSATATAAPAPTAPVTMGGDPPARPAPASSAAPTASAPATAEPDAKASAQPSSTAPSKAPARAPRGGKGMVDFKPEGL